MSNNQVVETYELIPSLKMVDEGKLAIFTLVTTNVPVGKKLAYTLSGIDAADIVGGKLKGEAIVGKNGKATISVNLVADKKTEGNETLTLKLDNGKAKSSVLIKDTSLTPLPTYNLTSSLKTVDEGKAVTFTLATNNLPIGTKVPYTITGIDATDLVNGKLKGEAVIDKNGKATVTFNIAADKKTEGNETLTLKLDNGKASSSVVIKDISLTPPPTYSLTPSAQSVDEGKAVTFTLATTNVPTGTKIAYTLSGIDAADLASGKLKGEAIVDKNGKATITVNLTADKKSEGDETLTLKLDNGKASSSVVIKDTSRSTEPAYTLTSSVKEINEGGLVTFSLQTENVAVGTRLDYTISGNKITTSDLLQPLTGAFVVGANGLATAQVKINADRSTEGVEQFTLKLNNNNASTTVKINDTSITPIPTVTSISRVFSTINEGDTAQFIVNTTDFTANTNLNYRIFGLNSDDIIGGAVTGIVTIGGDGKGIINIPIAEDHILEGTEFLDVAIDYIRNGSSTTIQSEASTAIADTSTPYIFGTDGNDTLIGSSFTDYIWGYGGDDWLKGEAGNDGLVGYEGADTLEGGDGDDSLYLGYGDFSDVATFEGEQAIGGEGNDLIVGTILSSGDNFSTSYDLFGDAKYDRSTTGGNDTLWGGNGFGRIDGGGGNDELYAYKAYDGNLYGGHGDDTLYAGYMHAVSGGPGYDRAYLLGNLSDYRIERNSDEGNIGINFRTSNFTRPDGSRFYYFLADVEEFVMADGVVRNTEQFIKDQNILWPGKTSPKDINYTLSSTNQSIIPGIPSISLSKTFGTPDIKKSLSKNLLDLGNSTIGAKIGANLSVDAKLEAYMEGGFSLGAIDTVIPVNGSITAARKGGNNLISVYSDYRFPSGASYQVKEPSAFFKAGIRGHLQANASIDVDAWANIPAVTAPNPFGKPIEITPPVNLKIDERLGLPANLTKRFDIEELIGGPFIDINALSKPSYSFSFPNGKITAEVPLIRFSNNGGAGDYLSGSGSDPFLTLNFDVASFIAEKLPYPLAYTFDQKFKSPTIAGYSAEAGVLAKLSVLKSDLIATASLVEEITVDFKGFRADFTIEGQAGPQDQLLYGGGTTQFNGFNLDTDGYVSVAATLEPVVEITNRTYIDLDVDLGVAVPYLEYKAWANVAGTSKKLEGSLSAFSQNFDLFNTDLPLFTKTWELGGFATQHVDFGAI